MLFLNLKYPSPPPLSPILPPCPSFPPSHQIELDKTAEAFRQAHRDREQVISQWEQTIAQMRKRDQDMDKCATVSEDREGGREAAYLC